MPVVSIVVDILLSLYKEIIYNDKEVSLSLVQIYTIPAILSISTSSEEIRRRAQEIIDEKESEIRRLESQIQQIKSAHFICAECRASACVCDLSNFKNYARRINRKRNKIENRIEKLDLQVV